MRATHKLEGWLTSIGQRMDCGDKITRPEREAVFQLAQAYDITPEAEQRFFAAHPDIAKRMEDSQRKTTRMLARKQGKKRVR
jgi:hypothetical protein